MDFESSFVHCIKTNDAKGLEAIGVNESIANRVFVAVHEVNQSEALNGVQVPKYPTPLVFAILCRQDDVVMKLVKIGAKLDVSVNGWKPIHYAIASNQVKLTRKLMDLNEQQVNFKSDRNATSLHFAVSSRSVELVEYLLIKGADPNAVNSNGNSPLHSAVFVNSQQILRDLIAFGAKIDLKNKQGKTPLDLANEKNYAIAIQVLNEKAISIDDVKSNYQKIQYEADEKDKSCPASDPGQINARIQNLSSRMSVIEEKLGLQ